MKENDLLKIFFVNYLLTTGFFFSLKTSTYLFVPPSSLESELAFK